MYILSPVPFVGLGFLFVALIGFIAVAASLDDHVDLIVCVICWYALIIPGAALALHRVFREARLFNRLQR